MTKNEERKIIKDAVAVISEIEPEAPMERLYGVIEGMGDDVNTWLAKHLVQADQYAWFFQGNWKRLAHGWLLLVLVGGPKGEHFDPPEKTQMDGYLQHLRYASEAEVRAGIISQLMGVEASRQDVAEATAILTDGSREAWDPSRFTDPRKHRAEQYCYIISALRQTVSEITEPGEVKFLRTHRAAFIRPVINKPNAVIYDLTKYYLSDPTAVCSEILSCSAISQHRKHTYKNMSFGLVLRVPKNNICNAAPRDLVAASLQSTARGSKLAGSSTYVRITTINDFLSQLAGKAKRGIPTPTNVLFNTAVNGHNEIIVVGTFMGQVRVTALFIKVNCGKLWDTFVKADVDGWLSKLMLDYAHAQNVPIIAIEDDSSPASNQDFDVWVRQRSSGRPRQMISDSLALTLAQQQPLSDERFPNIQMTLGEVRSHLAFRLNVPVGTSLDEMHRACRSLALTHHPDKTTDTEKQQKFIEVRGLLALLENGETGEKTPLSIKWKT